MSPRVPSFSEGIAEDVPGPQTENRPFHAGGVGRAIADVGSQLEQVSTQVFGQLNQQEADSSSFAQAQKDQEDSTAKALKLRTDSPDGYYRDDQGQVAYNEDGSQKTITQAYKEWAGDRFHAGQEAMKTGIAQREYVRRAQPIFINDTDTMLGHELQIRTSNAKIQKEEAIGVGLNALSSNPSEKSTYEEINKAQAEIRLGLAAHQYGALEAETLSHQYTEEAARTGVEGMYRLAKEAPADKRGPLLDAGEAFLHGQDPASELQRQMGNKTVSDQLDVKQKSALEEQFASLRKQTNTEDMSNFQAMVHAVETYYDLGQNDKAEKLIPQVNQGLSRLRASGQLKPFEADVISSMIKARHDVAAIEPTLANTPLDQRQRVANDEEQAVAGLNGGAIAEKFVREHLVYKAAKSIADEKADFGAWTDTNGSASSKANSLIDWRAPQAALKSPDGIKALADSFQEKQTIYRRDFADPGNVRTLSKTNSEAFAGWLKSDQTDENDIRSVIANIRSKDERLYSALVQDMVKDGKLPAGWRLVQLQNTELGMRGAIASLRPGKGLNDAFKTLAGPKITESMYDTAIAKEAGPILTAWISQNPESKYAREEGIDMLEAVKTRGKEMYVDHPAGNNANSLAKMATDSLLRSVLTPINLQTTRGVNPTIFPATIGGQPITDMQVKGLQGLSSGYMTVDGLKSLGIIAPKFPTPPRAPDTAPGVLAQDKKDQEASDQHYYQEMLKTGSFAPSTGGDSMHFNYTLNGVGTRAQMRAQDGRPTNWAMPLNEAVKRGLSGKNH